MGLGRVADFLLWIQKREIDWPVVLRAAGAGGAEDRGVDHAQLVPHAGGADVQAQLDAWIDSVRPGRLRAAYLRQWLERDLPSRWLDKPLLIQFGFTLALHDRPGDVMHALGGLRQARRNQARDMDALLGGES
jgi:hypothetical protein